MLHRERFGKGDVESKSRRSQDGPSPHCIRDGTPRDVTVFLQ